jgi:hypothetical protein
MAEETVETTAEATAVLDDGGGDSSDDGGCNGIDIGCVMTQACQR